MSMTEEREQELLTRMAALNEAGADGVPLAWTDNDDGDVGAPGTWTYEGSYFKKLADIYEEAGWGFCYHNSGARFHYNVKVSGGDRWRGVQAKIEEAKLNEAAAERVETYAAGDSEGFLEVWWEGQAYEFFRDYYVEQGHEPDYHDAEVTYYACGRSNGYFNYPHGETDGVLMVKLARFLSESVAWFTHRDFGAMLAEEAIERDNEEQMAALASPRPERIEA